MKLFTFCCLVFLLGLQSCGKHVEKYCYVLCDFSASQDEISRRQIIANADSLFRRCMENGYRMQYYDISDAAFRKPFFQHTVSTGPTTPTAREAAMKELNHLADSLHDSMEALRKAPSSKSTCIITTLEKVANMVALETQDDLKKKVRIVLLSDMQEDCTNSFIPIDIDNANIDTALAQLKKIPKPGKTFSDPDINIDFVASSERKIQSNAIESFWRHALEKFDYRKDFIISTWMPDLSK